jgi:phytoene desaturase
VGNDMNAYDTVIIGSGLGGLTTALCHAHAGERVLVLEQHTVPGGWCHSFSEKGYRFNTGVHYIGELSKGARIRNILEGLGLGEDITFCQLNPKGYEHVVIDGVQYDLPNGRSELKNYLVKLFPHEEKGINLFLNKTGKMGKELGKILDMEKLTDLLKLPFVAPSMARWGFFSYDSFVRKYIKDKQLIALLSAQAGDYAMPPNKALAPMHIGIFEHYMDGAFYPVGGGYKIPKAYVRALKKYKGEIRLATRAEKILTDGKGNARRVTGVKLANGEEIYCKKVVSNADPHTTFTKMLDSGSLSRRLQKRLDKTRYSTSCLALYLTVDMDLKEKGFDSGNYWIYSNNDINQIYELCNNEKVVEKDKLPFYYLSVTTLKDPSKKNKNYHSLELFTYLPFKPFEKWKDSDPENRPDDYIEFKEKLKNRCLDNLEEYIPGIRDTIRFCEMGTPLTNAHYLNGTDGSIFGTEKNRFQTGPFMIQPKTEIKNLYVCGASTLHGIFGALTSALFTSKISLKCTTRELLNFKDKEIDIYQSEDINSWPEKYHSQIKQNWGKGKNKDLNKDKLLDTSGA